MKKLGETKKLKNTRVGYSNVTIFITNETWNRTLIGDKLVETLYSNRVTSENKRIHTPPLPLHSKLRYLLFSTGSSNSGTTLHGGNGRGKGSFSPFKIGKTSKSPFRAKCLN